MATKKDLIEAQAFSRRRLLSAFTGGAPGGKELDPAKPLRAVVAGIALTAMVMLGGLFYGIIRPGLPQGWENNRLIVATDTGARYVSADGTLYPVINTASARLLIPAGEFKVITTDRGTLRDVPVGAAVGILGAPDDLPAPASLVTTGWTACVDDSPGVAVAVSPQPLAEPAAGSGVAVMHEGQLYIVAGDRRYAVPASSANAVLRAAGLGTTEVRDVDGRWLNLFERGTPLAPITLEGIGTPLRGTNIAAGEILHVQGDPADTRYLALASGELAPLPPLSYQLYLLGSGATVGGQREVTPAELAALPTADTAGGADWPEKPLNPLAETVTACAVLDTENASTVLGTTEEDLPNDREKISVAVGAGAVVRTGEATEGAITAAVLIDETGTAFALPAADEETLSRLGYADVTLATVPDGWIDFFPVGPALSSQAAGEAPTGEASP